MKKITFLVNDLTSQGGATKVTYQLASLLSHNYEVKIIGLFQSDIDLPYSLDCNVSYKTLYKKYIKIYELNTYKKYLLKFNIKELFRLFYNLIYMFSRINSCKKTLNELVKEDDIIIIPEIYGLLFLNRENLNIKKIILQLHNSFELIYSNRLNRITINTFKKYLNQLIVLTNADKNSFEQVGFQNVLQIYNSISVQPIVETNFEDRIVFLGRLDNRKGVEFIIPIFKNLTKKNTNIKLYIYGDGPLYSYLREQINREGLNNHIFLLGSTGDLTKVFKNTVCIIVPSKIEGLPMVMLEALSYSVPVVAFKCFAGIYEIIENNVNGYVVEYGDIDLFSEKVLSFFENTKHTSNMKKNAFESSLKFSEKIIINQWINLFEQIMESSET